jgi:hypothetical protein
MTDPAYQLDPDHPAHRGLRTNIHKQIDANAAHRESLLPCSGSAGQPLAPKEPVEAIPEWVRLCRDPAGWAQMIEARKAAGL